MRFLFYILLIANIVFFLWSLGHRSGAERHVDAKSVEAPGKLLLLSEAAAFKVEAKPAASEKQPEESTDARVSAGDSACYRTGPFAEPAEARRALNLIKEWIDKPTLVTESSETLDGYWLLYPRAPNMDEGKGNRKMLIDKGVKDVWLIDKGDMAGMISLGIFKTREEAETELQRLSKLNVQIQVRPRISQSETTWVQFDWPKSGVELDEVMIQLRGENPEVSVPAIRACPRAQSPG